MALPTFRPAIVFLARHAEGLPAFQAFLNSYCSHRAGCEHDLIIVFKGFTEQADRESATGIFAQIEHRPIFVNDVGYDIGTYFDVAQIVENELICFLNTHSCILENDWLKLMYEQVSMPDVGVVGATGSLESNRDTTIFVQKALWFYQHLESEQDEQCIELRKSIRKYLSIHLGLPPASHLDKDSSEKAFCLEASDHYSVLQRNYQKWWEQEGVINNSAVSALLNFPDFPNPHIRTNAFMIRRSLFLNLVHDDFVEKMATCHFESGAYGMTRQILRAGLKARIVARNGQGYDVPAWPESETFRSGKQRLLMISDNHTRMFEQFDASTQKLFELVTWGENSVSLPADFPMLGLRFEK